VIVGQRVSALRFGDPRVMALLQVIIGFTHLPHGFRNRDLRPQVEAFWGRPYRADASGEMTRRIISARKSNGRERETYKKATGAK